MNNVCVDLDSWTMRNRLPRIVCTIVAKLSDYYVDGLQRDDLPQIVSEKVTQKRDIPFVKSWNHLVAHQEHLTGTNVWQFANCNTLSTIIFNVIYLMRKSNT